MYVLYKVILILGLNIILSPCSLLGYLAFHDRGSPVMKSLKSALDDIASATNARHQSVIPEELNISPNGSPVSPTGLNPSINGVPVNRTVFSPNGGPVNRSILIPPNGAPVNRTLLPMFNAADTPPVAGSSPTEHRDVRNDHRGINFNFRPQQAPSMTWQPTKPNQTIHRPMSPTEHNNHSHLQPSSTTTGSSLFVFNSSYNVPTEGRILNPPGQKPPKVEVNTPHIQNLPSTINSLCDLCLCSIDKTIVRCEHKHSKNDWHIMILESKSIPKQVRTLHFKGYESIEVRPHAVASNPELKEVVFEDINKLILVSNSLFFSSESSDNRKVFLKFKNCNIPTFPEDALTQNVEGRHENKNIFANERRRYMSIDIVSCRIGTLEKNSLRRAQINNFYVLKSHIMNIVSNAIDLEVINVTKFESNRLGALPTKAICLHSATTVFQSNYIKQMANRSIVIESDNNVFIDSNMLDDLRAGALAGIETFNSKLGPSIYFTNNHLMKLEPNSLKFGSSYPPIKQNFINNTFNIQCDCNIQTSFESFMGKNTFETLSFNVAFQSSQYCVDTGSEAILLSNFLKEECAPFPVVIVTAVSVAIVLFIIAVTVCVVCTLRVQQVKEEANMLGECTSQSFSTLSRNYPDTLRQPCDEPNTPSFAVLPWGVAFPEIKTYQLQQTPEFTEQTESICGSTRGSMKDRRSDLFTRYPDRSSCPFN